MAATENTYILEGKESVNSTNTMEMEDESPNSPTDTREIIKPEGASKQVTSNLPQTGFNYINSIIGSGVIGIAYALHQAGFGLGVILLVVIAIATDYSLCILVKAASIVGATTYQDLVQVAFGKFGFYLLTLVQFVYPFVAMVSYNVIIGDTITKVFMRLFSVSRTTVLGNRNFVVFITTLLVTLPLSLYRSIAKLTKASAVSLLFALFIMGFILFRIGTMDDIDIPVSPNAYSFVNTGVTEAIGVISFAFMCHHNSFLLYAALENPTRQRWYRITHISVGFALVIIVIFGVGGYATFTGLSQGDLLENYCMNDDWANAARLMFTVTIMLTYPIECFVAREVVENTFFSARQPSSMLRHSAVTVGIVTCSYCLSILTDCLGIVLEINGVLAAVPLAYVLPAITYLKVEEGHLLSLRKAPSLLLALLGMTVAVVGTIKVIINIMAGVHCSHGAEMSYCTDAVAVGTVFNASVEAKLSQIP